MTAEKKYEIGPLSAPIVKEIFQMYASGYTITEIINTLNKQGKRTANGTPFTNNSLSKLLHNKKYIGLYERAGVTIEGGVPSIVDETVFNQVQEQMKKNKKAPARRKSPMDFLLTTKIFCGKCNAPMTGDSGTSKTQAVHYYYICSHKKRFRKCAMKSVKKDWIENLVVKQTVKSVLQDDVIDYIADKIIIYLENDHDSSKMLSALQSKKKTVEKSIANIIKAIEQGIITESTKERLLELEAEKSDIEIQELQNEIRKPQTGKKELIYWLNSFKNGDIEDIDYQRKIIDAFVNAVYVFDDKMVITYNYTDNQKQLTIDEVKTAIDELHGDCFLSSDLEDNSP